MRKFLFLALLIAFVSSAALALDIPKGKFYFDNTKTNYSIVKFIYGSDVREECYVISMSNEGNGLWSITIPETVKNMYRYTFAATTLADGEQGKNFNTVKNDISNNRNELRTATREDEIIVGWKFTPANGDNWAQGSWVPLTSGGGSGTERYSGTLPVLHISTASEGTMPSFCTYINDYYFAYFENSDNWDEVGCYIWKNNAPYITAGWPGDKCELVGTADNGNQVWLWRSSSPKSANQAPENIIFNNNQMTGGQTADLPFVNGGYYTLNLEAHSEPDVRVAENGEFIGKATPITSKEEYVHGTYYIDNLNLDDYTATGSADAPLGLQIRGRGNYTWKDFDKKPYRLKLDEKASLLGGKKSKHFTLLAHADDDLAFLRNTVGFQLSRLLGLDYTPAQFPIEVVLNGDYIGLYMLTDHIRVDKDRVNIVEQADNETLAEIITGGWLLEIDNYDEEEQLRMTEGNGEILRFTYHSPELLSTEQYNYLSSFMTAADHAIYSNDKNSTDWEKYIDMEALAKFYIIQEVMDNGESFHGSCYMSKDRGENTKLVFGPVWDFGNSFRRNTDRFIYDGSPFGQNWIGEIAKFPRFQQTVKKIWQEFYPSKYSQLDAFINDFISQIAGGAASDAVRWPQYGHNDVSNRSRTFKNMMNSKVDFLRGQWGEGSGINDISVTPTQQVADNTVYDLQGRPVMIADDAAQISSSSLARGIYIHQGKKLVVR